VTKVLSKKNSSPPSINRRHLLSYLLIFIISPCLTFVLGLWLDEKFLLPKFPPIPVNFLLGSIVLFTGLAIGIHSTRILYKFGKGLPWGEFAEETRTSKLTITGAYSYCRNPMTIGYSMLPCGMGIMFRSLTMTLLIPSISLAVSIIWIKLREEPNLVKRFGDSYKEYKKKTPFLIPMPKFVIYYLVNLKKILLEKGD